MSHILDALRKSERERDVGNVARIGVIDGYPALPRRRWELWIATTLIIVNGLALALLLEGIPVTIAIAPNEMDPINRESGSSGQLLDDAVRPVSGLFTPERSDRAIVDTYLDIDEVQRLDEERRHQRSTVLLSRTHAVRDLVVESHWEGLDAPTTGDTPLMRSTMASQTSSDTALEALADTTSVPLLIEMDPDYQQSLPALSLDVHVHAESVQNRFVLINQKKYRTGDHIQGGASIETIRPDGVVLVHQKRRFLLVPK